MTDIRDFSMRRSLANKLDDITQIKRELFQAPCPLSRIVARELSVACTVIRTNVGEPDVVALIDEPECQGALFAHDKVRRVAEDAVLKYDWVAGAAWTTRVGEAVRFEDPAAFRHDFVFVAAVSPVLERITKSQWRCGGEKKKSVLTHLGIVLHSTGPPFTGDTPLILSISPSPRRFLRERVKVPRKRRDKN